jgi:hypothetical protein
MVFVILVVSCVLAVGRLLPSPTGPVRSGDGT